MFDFFHQNASWHNENTRRVAESTLNAHEAAQVLINTDDVDSIKNVVEHQLSARQIETPHHLLSMHGKLLQKAKVISGSFCKN